jgi:deoxyadenosine/deoxycytidine kinase
MVLVVSVEGNVGAGKSTFIQRLEDMGVAVLPEEVDAWGDALKLFARDKSRWGFLLQVRIALSNKLRDPRKLFGGRNIVFVERSPHSSLHIFAANLHSQGHLTEVEHDLLKEMMAAMWTPDAVIVLDDDPATCYERTVTRARGEEGVSLEYIRMLGELYRNYEVPDCPILRTTSTTVDPKEVVKYFSQITPSHHHKK